jgi:hypothetical protein
MGDTRGDERALLLTVEFSLPPKGRGVLIPAEDFSTCYLLYCTERCSVAIRDGSTNGFHPNKLHYNSDNTVTLAAGHRSALLPAK